MTNPLAPILGFEIDLGLAVKKESSYESLIELDTKLQTRGIHPLSEWWRTESRRFYTHRAARRWRARIGRGGAKSTGICKIGLNEVLNQSWAVPPGEMHYFAIVSENKEEASNRLLLLDQCLAVLNIEHKLAGSKISIPSIRLGFRVLACRIGAVSGFRAIGYAADEVAKWSDDGADPSDEIITSLEAMTVTHPLARGLVFSSPMARMGLHYEMVEEGNTETQIVSIAPSWIANPAISEATTRTKERSERKWLREYAAVPQGDAAGVFDMDAVERCMQLWDELEIETQAGTLIIIDASRGGDAWTYGAARWVWSKGKARFRFVEIDEVSKPPPGVEFTAHAVSEVCAFAAKHKADTICGDQFESGALKALFSAKGLTFWEHTWTATSKRIAVDHLESWFRDEVLLIPNHPILKRQLAEYKERISRTNEITYSGSGPNDDFVQMLMTAAMAFDAKRFEMVEAPIVSVKVGTPEYWQEKERKIEEQLRQRVMRQRREREDW